MAKIFPKVSVIVICTNERRFLKNCLNSLIVLNYPKDKFEIVIVDNASSDGSVEFIQNNYPEVKLIKNKKNLGFATANNVAFKQCQTEYVALLNPDSKVNKNWLKELVTTMMKNPDVACCGAVEHPYNTRLQKDIALKSSTNLINQVWMGGGSIIFRRQALKQVNYFDEFFFWYGEDIDISWKFKIRGWRIMLNPNAIWHHYGWDRKVNLTDKRLFYSLKHYFIIMLKFGSLRQLIASFSYLIFKHRKKQIVQKNTENKINKDVINLNKKKLLLTIFLSIIKDIPYLLKERIKIKLNQKVPQKEVDQWIQYTNNQFFSK